MTEIEKGKKEEVSEDWEAEADPDPVIRGYKGPTKERKERLKRLKQETQQREGPPITGAGPI